ncbi:MAG: 4Fe-4S dicluster domain-containing protein [Chloroflexota bacterium]
MADKAILYDASKCTACRGCQITCKQWNENDEAIPTVENGVQASNWGSYENPRDLSPTTWIKMKFTEVEPAPGKVRWLFTRRACMHCTDAACVRVCPNGTLYHDENGFVVYNHDTCTGCGYCVDACPFDVPRLAYSGPLGIAGKMSKCSFCTSPGYNRIAEGMEPACVKTCPPPCPPVRRPRRAGGGGQTAHPNPAGPGLERRQPLRRDRVGRPAPALRPG